MMASGTGGSRRWWAVGALVLAVLVVGIDATVLSLALPTLATALHASTADMQWFVAAYTLVFAAAMIPGGMLGDRYGRKKLLLISLAVFGASSLACAYSPSPGAFIAARAVLGLGGAVMLPMVIGQLPVLFAAEERAKAIAAVMAATMVGYPIGPILGGWLLTNYWWGSVFLINVPVVVLALIAVLMWLPESRSCRAATVRYRRHRHLERRPCRAPLRGDPGGAVRLGREQRGGQLHRRRGGAGGLRALGAARARPPRGPHALPLGALHLGHAPDDDRLLRHVRGAVRRAAVHPGDPGQGRVRQRPAPAAHGRRVAGRRRCGYPAWEAGRRQGHCGPRLRAAGGGLVRRRWHERDQRPGVDRHVDRRRAASAWALPCRRPWMWP